MATDAGLTFIVLIVIWISLIIWISKDSSNRGQKGNWWGLATLIFPYIVVPLYFIFRPKGRLIKCYYCEKEKLETLIECPHCHNTSKGIIIGTSSNPGNKSKPECVNCGIISDDVEDYDGILLCSNCNEEVQVEDESKEEDDNPVVEISPETRKLDLHAHTVIVEIKNEFKKEPLSKINVSLQNDIDKFERISDIDGKVIFGKVKNGIYTLNIISKSFQEESRRITVNKNLKIVVELKGKSNLIFNIQDIVNGRLINDAIVKLGNREVLSDEKGVALISDVSFGKCELTVTKESYKIESSTIEVKDIQQKVKIFLKPDIKLNEEYIILGEKIKNSLNESMKRMSTACDMCIPEYYKSICHEIIKFNETIASTPVYVYDDQSVDKINTLYTITDKICKEMEATLTNSENIADFISMRDRNLKTIAEIRINPSDYDSMTQEYMSDPIEFTEKYKLKILNKLQETDKEITNYLQTFNINHAACLWSICQKIITNAKNKYEAAASLLLISILLDATIKMFKNEELIKRLKKIP